MKDVKLREIRGYYHVIFLKSDLADSKEVKLFKEIYNLATRGGFKGVALNLRNGFVFVEFGKQEQAPPASFFYFFEISPSPSGRGRKESIMEDKSLKEYCLKSLRALVSEPKGLVDIARQNTPTASAKLVSNYLYILGGSDPSSIEEIVQATRWLAKLRRDFGNKVFEDFVKNPLKYVESKYKA